jgi:hypothetical protein
LGKETAPLTAGGVTSQLDLAKKWLNVCSDTHKSCKSAEDRQLPTRLIDVGSTPIRLVLTSTFTEKPRYATLSHCWGTGDFLKLKENSLEDFMKAIPEEKLTKTFQDALHITRSLGLQYLWIDSLCIIQLSDLEWRRESALMSSVYGGSAITIAASGATDGSKGFFLKPPGFVGKVHIEPTKDEVWDIAPSEFYTSVVNSHLAGRAWALQERLLSPRRIHFSKTELFWECQHCDASESFPEGLPEFEHQHVFHRDHGKPLSEIWPTIVRLYTSGKLTFPTDKLVAISGIAQHVQQENLDQYLAGLWRKDIELQLLWCQQSPGRRLPKGSEYRAPSWSWASVDEKGYAHYTPRVEGSEYKYYSRVVDAHVVPLGKESFGELVGGLLEITCSVMLAGKLRKIQGEKWNDIDFSFHEVDIESSDGKETFRVYPDSDEYDGEDIYILPVVDVLGKEKHNKRTVSGLLLYPADTEKGEFVRAGFFSFSAFDERCREIQERFLKVAERSGRATAEEQCAEVLSEPEFPDERYVITII